jgi:hypothetical protein
MFSKSSLSSFFFYFFIFPFNQHYILTELLKNAMKATMDFHIRQYSSNGDDDRETVTHQESLETLQSPLSKYQRSKGSHHHRVPKPVPNVENIPNVTVIIADSPDNEDVIIKVSSR